MNNLRLTFIFSFFIYTATSSAQYHSKDFKLENQFHSKSLSVDKEIEKDTTLFIDIRCDIKGLYVTGHVSLYDDVNSYLRIVLQDCNDMEYLVYETYSLISESKESDFITTALETKFLDGVRPKCLKIKVANSRLQLDKVTFVEGKVDTWKKRLQLESGYKRQVSSVVDILNNQLSAKNRTWRAGVTDVSLMTYEEKRQLFGGDVPPLAGLEHYKTGVFVMPDLGDIDSIQETNTSNQRSTIDMVKEWDWRNRHGKNWLTSAKWQGNCGACWAFATTGYLEAYINLYYNKLLNYDLSEQELVSCCYSDYYGCDGGYYDDGLVYVSEHGVVMDSCFEYSETVVRNCSEKCSNPSEVISLDGVSYSVLPNNSEERTLRIKELLFRSPLLARINTIHHELVLVGYKYLETGDTIYFPNNDNPVVINSTMAGQTAWLYKNSWGTSWGDNGFGYMVMNYPLTRVKTLNESSKITSLIHNDDDILVTDEDGDGYYVWGVGVRPSTVPVWAPIKQDGDDGNVNLGPISHYYGTLTGELDVLDPAQTPPLEITTNTLWATPSYYCQNIIVRNGATLEITNETGFHKDCIVEVLQGGKLKLNGGSIYNATVIVRAGGEGLLENEGKITGRSDNTLVLEQGSVFEMVSGQIE